jgi:hypothetical protein
VLNSFTESASSLNIVTHSATFFTPVAPLTTNGQTSGPFQRPQVQQFGDLPYNGSWGPGLFTTDLALSKVFNLYESLTMKLEVQAQNAFNHANLANPTNTCIDCSGNGQITDILGGTFAGMRQLQFVARFSF